MSKTSDPCCGHLSISPAPDSSLMSAADTILTPAADTSFISPDDDSSLTSASRSSFKTYAAKLGYPDNLIDRVLSDMESDISTEELLERLISLQDLLCPKDSTARRRRDASNLPTYMLVQDCYYKGKERMPFWVWVKRETISVSVTEHSPHKRRGSKFNSSQTTSSETTSRNTPFRSTSSEPGLPLFVMSSFPASS